MTQGAINAIVGRAVLSDKGNEELIAQLKSRFRDMANAVGALQHALSSALIYLLRRGWERTNELNANRSLDRGGRFRCGCYRTVLDALDRVENSKEHSGDDPY